MAIGFFLKKVVDASIKISETVDDVSKKLSEATDDASSKMSEAMDEFSKVASTTTDSINSVVSKTVDSVTDSISSAYDRMCEMAVLKIQDILKGANLQETLDSLEKYEKESGQDLSSLKEFITRIKIFSENGSK